MKPFNFGDSKDFVWGHLLYTKQYEFSPGEVVTLTFLNKQTKFKMGESGPEVLERILIDFGIPAFDIIGGDFVANQELNTVELVFAYRGKTTNREHDIWLQNSHHKFGSYSVQNGIIIPAFTLIPIKTLQELADVVTACPVSSFMAKPFSVEPIAFKILASGVRDGVLADMRNMANSFRLVDFFKERNWQRIIYKTSTGIMQNIVRPVKGW